MSISATRPANLSTLQFASIRGTKLHDQVEAVSPEAPGTFHGASVDDEREKNINVDPAVEIKLSKLRDVQYAFASALKTANFLESNYFFDPIV